MTGIKSSLEQNETLFEKERVTCYPIKSNIGQTYIIPKYIKKDIEKRSNDFLYNGKKIKAPRHLVQLSI